MWGELLTGRLAEDSMNTQAIGCLPDGIGFHGLDFCPFRIADRLGSLPGTYDAAKLIPTLEAVLICSVLTEMAQRRR